MISVGVLWRIPPWRWEYWFTSRGAPVNTYREGWAFHTVIPIFVH